MLGSSVKIGGGGAGGAGGAVSIGMDDDVHLHLGTDADDTIYHKSATNNADTAITGVLIGTPDTHALAANSLIIANATADGDILIAGNDGGTSRQFIYCDVSAGNIYLGGKDGTPGSATGIGDVYIAGKLEVDAKAYFDFTVTMADDQAFILGADSDAKILFSAGYFTNADCLYIKLPTASGGVVPAVPFVTGDHDELAVIKFMNGLTAITQPTLLTLEKNKGYTYSSTGTSTAGSATAILIEAGKFTNSIIGDRVRIISGTNCTAGWYWITTVTSADQVILDRNFCTNDTTNCTYVVVHGCTMITPEGICTRITDGTPTDSSTELDMDGWIIDDVGSNQLYHRSQTTWRALQNAKRTVEAVTTTNALTEAESGSVFTNLGDSDGATCTLPADAAAGTNYTFTLQAAQEFKIIVGKAASVLYIGGTISTDDGGNDLYVSADDEGESITLCCDGANGWFPLAINGTWTVTQP